MRADSPAVSVVIPARDEADYLPATLESLADQETDLSYEVIVVDGNSADRTAEIAREHGARVLVQERGGIGAARDRGARAGDGEWIAFVDADTRVRPAFLDRTVAAATERDLGAVAPLCRVIGDPRGRALEWAYNHLFPRKEEPILPGFATVVRREAFEAAGGYPDVASEDRAFSHALSATTTVGFHPEVLVETSARRVARNGLVRTAARYFLLDLRTLRDPDTRSTVPTLALSAGLLSALAALAQLVHGTLLGHGAAPGHLTAIPASAGHLGGIALYALGAARSWILLGGVAFVAVQVALWVATGARHGAFGIGLASLDVLLGLVLVAMLWRRIRAGQ